MTTGASLPYFILFFFLEIGIYFEKKKEFNHNEDKDVQCNLNFL